MSVVVEENFMAPKKKMSLQHWFDNLQDLWIRSNDRVRDRESRVAFEKNKQNYMYQKN